MKITQAIQDAISMLYKAGKSTQDKKIKADYAHAAAQLKQAEEEIKVILTALENLYLLPSWWSPQRDLAMKMAENLINAHINAPDS